MQQNEISTFRQEIDQLKLQQETTARNIETASTSSVTELQSIIDGLQSEVTVERGRKKSEERMN